MRRRQAVIKTALFLLCLSLGGVTFAQDSPGSPPPLRIADFGETFPQQRSALYSRLLPLLRKTQKERRISDADLRFTIAVIEAEDAHPSLTVVSIQILHALRAEGVTPTQRPEIIRILMKVLQAEEPPDRDRVGAIKGYAADAIGVVPDRAFIPVVEALTKDPRDGVSFFAGRSLEHLKKRYSGNPSPPPPATRIAALLVKARKDGRLTDDQIKYLLVEAEKGLKARSVSAVTEPLTPLLFVRGSEASRGQRDAVVAALTRILDADPDSFDVEGKIRMACHTVAISWPDKRLLPRIESHLKDTRRGVSGSAEEAFAAILRNPD